MLDPLVGNDPTVAWAVTKPFGPNIYYDVIPFEMLRTDEVNPQVIVKVDDIAAVCSGLACDFVYEPSTALITSFTVTGSTIDITGTTLPTADTVHFGY